MRIAVLLPLAVWPALIAASGAYAEDPAYGKGVSHLTRCALSNFELQCLSPPAAPEWANRQPPGTASIITVVQPSGWKGVWHQESKVYWIVTPTGKWFVEAMDGTRVELGPGDVSLGEDQIGVPDAEGRKGHRSGNIGDETVTLMHRDRRDADGRSVCRFK